MQISPREKFRHESSFSSPGPFLSATRNSNTRDSTKARKQSRQRSADCQVLHDPLAEDALLQRARRLRARSEVFIGAVNSRNPVTLSPSHEQYLRLRSCSLSETRAPITPIRFCIVIPKDSAISCSSPQLFPRRSSFSSASPPRSFFSYFPLIFVRSKKIFSKFSSEFFFPILLLLGSFAKEAKTEENFVNSRKLDPSISHLSFDHFRSFYLHVSLPPFFPPIGLFLPRLYAHLALTPLRFSCTLPANFLPDLPPTSKRSIQGTPVAAKPRPLNLGLWVQRCHRILPKENISIDERGQEKAAFSASVIKPTGYKYSLSLSFCYRQFDLDFKSAIISHVERYISIYLGTIALNAKKGKIVMHLS